MEMDGIHLQGKPNCLLVPFAAAGLRRMILRTLGRVGLGQKAPEVEAAEGSQTGAVDSSFAINAISRSIISDPTKAQVLVELLGGDVDRIATLMLNNLRQTSNADGRRHAIRRFPIYLFPQHRYCRLCAMVTSCTLISKYNGHSYS